jgi:hypothetical protein
MIVEENVLGWNNIPVKTDEVIYPQAKDDKAPKNYFLGIFCGCRGSGKSYLFTKLLNQDRANISKPASQYVVFISDTYSSNMN